jgi:hypothetical protein
MYHAIITNLTTSPIMMASNIMRPTRIPPMPTYPPPRLYKLDEDDSEEYASEEYVSEEYVSEEYASEEEEDDEDEEQLMQITCPSLQILIEINKTPSSLNIVINGEYKYSIVLYPSLTFQDVYDSILIHFPALNELKFKLKWHENMGEERSIKSKEFMKTRIDKLPLSRGEIVDKKIHKCNLCRTESIHITKKCGACRKVYYCSASCQKLNWPYHKMKCS